VKPDNGKNGISKFISAINSVAFDQKIFDFGVKKSKKLVGLSKKVFRLFFCIASRLLKASNECESSRKNDT